MRRARPLQAISVGGLVAGTLDIAAAFAIYGTRGVAPLRILQSIASGLLGAAAYHGGARTAALGLLLHFFIATVAAGVYYAASRKLAILVRRPALAGFLYGITIYFFMNLVVLPLSAVARRPFTPDVAVVLAHMLCVGLPIALSVRRYGCVPQRS